MAQLSRQKYECCVHVTACILKFLLPSSHSLYMDDIIGDFSSKRLSFFLSLPTSPSLLVISLASCQLALM